MRDILLNYLIELGKKHNSKTILSCHFGKVVKYELIFPDTDIRISMQNRKGGAL